jgi:hypothetical protein
MPGRDEGYFLHLTLTFVAAKPSPPRIASQELLMAAEAGSEYLSRSSLGSGGKVYTISVALEHPRGFLVRLEQFPNVIDISSACDLYFHMMIGWEIEIKIHNQPSLAKTKFLSIRL